MSYSICSYISSDNTDVLRVTLDSWIKSDCKDIHIFTDGPTNIPYHEKISVSKIFDQTSDVGTQYARKAESLIQLRTKIHSNIVMIDADCLLLKGLKDIFKKKFDVTVSIGAGVDPRKPFNNVSAGFVGVKHTMEGIRFVKDWVDEQRKNIRHKCRDQIALSNILTKGYKNSSMIINPLYELEINCYPLYNNQEHITNWIKKIEQNTHLIRIIHFAFQTWKNESLVKYLLSIPGV